MVRGRGLVVRAGRALGMRVRAVQCELDHLKDGQWCVKWFFETAQCGGCWFAKRRRQRNWGPVGGVVRSMTLPSRPGQTYPAGSVGTVALMWVRIGVSTRAKRNRRGSLTNSSPSAGKEKAYRKVRGVTNSAGQSAMLPPTQQTPSPRGGGIPRCPLHYKQWLF